jgi:tetratricopeptide (TPR) repeat protein
VDRDLYARALGPQPEFYRISTCPRCGYSGYAPDFVTDLPMSAELRDRIRRELTARLPEGFGPQSDPRELDAADRYALAITCYTWQQRSDEALAWLHLRASWIARQEGSVLPADARLQRVMTFIERWKPTMEATDNQVEVEFQTAARIAEALSIGRFNRFQRPHVELALAMILRRHGENRLATPPLERAGAYPRLSPALRDGIARMQESIRREREHQTQAARYFERSLLAGSVSRENRGPACYLLGELLRRLGRDAEALAWYDRALSDDALPADLHAWAEAQRSWAAAR